MIVKTSFKSAKSYLATLVGAGVEIESERMGLRWFFSSAMKHDNESAQSKNVQGIENTAGRIDPEKADQGETEWEKRLVERLRVGQYKWRTEQTYREWMWRFFDWFGRDPLSAETEDVKKFLSWLAVKRGVSASTQRQALNALVFFFRKVIGNEPGDLGGYSPSKRGAKFPTVLTKNECKLLFANLDGTASLMGRLMYGAGLRVMELLRLRVQDLDFGRGILIVREGKGGKDRPTVLPEGLRKELAEHHQRPQSLAAGYRMGGRAAARVQGW